MGWVRLDDNFADHPKVIGLSDYAFRLYIHTLCYSNRQLTDGFIASTVFERMSVSNDRAWVELEEAGLWEVTEGGFIIRSYAEYQPLREMVEEKREQARERLRRFREKRDGNADETPPPTHTQPNPKI
jgi:hypothetical protein